jgi:hypothetical protein
MRRISSVMFWLSVSAVVLAAHPLLSGEGQPSKMKATAIQVEMIQCEEINLPAEFQVAIYENLIHQLEKQGGFQHVYREGDRNAKSVPDLVIFRGTLLGFKPGSEEARQVTTIAGETSITVHCRFTNTAGKTLLEKDINGKVRFFGGNLKATYDFAKKAARIASENFSPSGQN